MHRCYVPREWIDSFIANNHAVIPDDAFVRFFSVVRIKPHESVAVFDGQGREVVGTLVKRGDNKNAHFSQASVSVVKPWPKRIILVQAAIDESKISETIKRGCEYGVDHFIIFDAKQSDKFCYNKLLAKKDRLTRIAQDACRQSERIFIPDIDFIDSLSLLFELKKDDDVSFGVFGDLKEENLLSRILAKKAMDKDNFFVVIGPEGGLHSEECKTLTKHGFFGVQWAPFVLRSELAGLAAVTILQAFFGRA